MRTTTLLLFLVVAVVNLVPVLGVISTDRLRDLYGVSVEDPNLAILLRHRAVLFGIVGALLAGAAFHTPLRPVAGAAGLVSMLSFVAVVFLVGESNAELTRVVRVDLAASVLLVVALALGWSKERSAG